jgi:hypothetical protein
LNCIHGIDVRFCAACNPSRAQRSFSTAQVSLEEILRFLNEEQVRVTYGAVAEVLGVIPRALGTRLGARRPEASWIVSAENSLPTDYSPDEWHPALLSRADVITNGTALLLRMSNWRRTRKESR